MTTASMQPTAGARRTARAMLHVGMHAHDAECTEGWTVAARPHSVSGGFSENSGRCCVPVPHTLRNAAWQSTIQLEQFLSAVAAILIFPNHCIRASTASDNANKETGYAPADLKIHCFGRCQSRQR